MSVDHNPINHHILVGAISVLQKTEGRKKNPNSLRFLMAHVINAYFSGNISLAVERLAPFGGKYMDENHTRPAKSLNEKNLPKLLRDEIHIAYWHIEIFARFLGVPSGVFVLISREVSYFRYNLGREGAPLFISCMENFTEKLKEATKGRENLDNNLLKSLIESATHSFAPLREHDNSTKMLF